MTDREYDLGEVQWPDTPFQLIQNAILLMRRGSEAHGTYLPSTDPESIDDRDIMGVLLPPLEYYFGTRRWEHAEAIKGCWDVVLYSFQKFLGLLVKQNPNVVSMLWLRPEDYLLATPEGRALIEARYIFRARRPAYDSFIGYARGQFQRMTHFHHQGYMGAKRKALADLHGYDTKNAAHLVRLLRMGAEFQRTGEMTVYRTFDRQQILDIKQGKWPLEEVKLLAAKLFDEAEHALYESVLPEEIDRDAVDELAVRITREHLGILDGSRLWRKVA